MPKNWLRNMWTIPNESWEYNESTNSAEMYMLGLTSMLADRNDIYKHNYRKLIS